MKRYIRLRYVSSHIDLFGFTFTRIIFEKQGYRPIDIFYFYINSLDLKGVPPPQKSRFFEEKSKLSFCHRKMHEVSSFRIYMAFQKTDRFSRTYRWELGPTTMFFIFSQNHFFRAYRLRGETLLNND